MALTPKPRGNVVYSAHRNNITDSSTETNPSSYSWVSLSVYNTGDNDLHLIVNNVLVVIGANETFDDDFVDFNTVIIRPAVSGLAISFRLVCRG